MQLIIVRHGETLENLQGICQGQTHGTLSERGIRQAEEVAYALSGEAFERCYTSDLRRAYLTCMAILRYHPSIAPVIDVRLRERAFGIHQGKPFPEGRIFTDHPEEVESEEQLFGRVDQFLKTLPKSSGNFLIVSHGQTIRTIIACLTGCWTIGESREVSNASITRLERTPQGDFQLITFNQTDHLERR